MINPTGRADKALGIQLQNVYKTISSASVDRCNRKDMLSISPFSTLVEQAKNTAMSLPDIRKDKVEEIKSKLAANKLPESFDIASNMIDKTIEGQV